MSISPEQLERALSTLHHAWQQLDEDTEWENVKLLRQYGISFLRITKHLRQSQGEPQADSAEVEESLEMDDEEALQPNLVDGVSESRAVYDIVHSPSYQVPVLYLTIKSLAIKPRPSLDEMYKLTVPYSNRLQMQAVGVMGGLSLTEHPVTGLSTYFVHPCRTQEALEPHLLRKEVSPAEYLLLWFGVIGGSIGLDVPLKLAKQFATDQPGMAAIDMLERS